MLIFEITKAVCSGVAKNLGARISAFSDAGKFRADNESRDLRIEFLEGEVKAWKKKFDRVWSAWHKLAIETKGAEEAQKMAEQLTHNTDTELAIDSAYDRHQKEKKNNE